jgi:tRNA threonylcarbamoyl adenosine modification protein (Sua5/YciO/YrdC/YwlC family)
LPAVAGAENNPERLDDLPDGVVIGEKIGGSGNIRDARCGQDARAPGKRTFPAVNRAQSIMKRLAIHPMNPQGRQLKTAAESLKAGGLIIYPTDSVYGLGCDLFNKKAVERIYQIKGNDKRKLLSFICADLKNISEYAYVSNSAYKIMRHLLPGPYTFILNATKQVPKILLETRKTVGIRVPDNTVCHGLLAEFGSPIISTSACLPHQEYLSDPDDLAETFARTVDLFLDSGPGGLELSTIVDLTADEPVLIRQGRGLLQ